LINHLTIARTLAMRIEINNGIMYLLKYQSLQRELEKQMEFFAEKIWLLSLARKASEKR
jgi:hypothetical protein